MTLESIPWFCYREFPLLDLISLALVSTRMRANVATSIGHLLKQRFFDPNTIKKDLIDPLLNLHGKEVRKLIVDRWKHPLDRVRLINRCPNITHLVLYNINHIKQDHFPKELISIRMLTSRISSSLDLTQYPLQEIELNAVAIPEQGNVKITFPETLCSIIDVASNLFRSFDDLTPLLKLPKLRSLTLKELPFFEVDGFDIEDLKQKIHAERAQENLPKLDLNLTLNLE